MYIKLGTKKFDLMYSLAPINIGTYTKDGSNTLSVPANSLYYKDYDRYMLYDFHVEQPTIHFDDDLQTKYSHVIQMFQEFVLKACHQYNPDIELNSWVLDTLVESFCNDHDFELNQYELYSDVVREFLYLTFKNNDDIFINRTLDSDEVYYVDRDNQVYTLEDFADFINLV